VLSIGLKYSFIDGSADFAIVLNGSSQLVIGDVLVQRKLKKIGSNILHPIYGGGK
jgi:hypothetical protein